MQQGPADGGGEVGVKSARRAVEIVEVLAGRAGWSSLGDLHHSTGVPRSSLHGLIRTLQDAGWIEADRAGTAFRLGVRALTAGTAYRDHDPVIPHAIAALERIRERTGFTTHFARRFGDSVVYLETREALQHSTRLASRVGRTLPVYATALGKALLAELVDVEIAELLPETLPPLTPHTLPTREALLADCAAIRRRGWAAEVEEGTPGVRCVAAVVPYRIPASDAISCSIPVGLVTDEQAAATAAVLAEATADLGRTLRMAGIR